MKKRVVLLAALGVALAIGYIFYSLTTLGRVSCEVCVTYNGRTDCRAGAGSTEEEAQRTALDVACSLLSSGMADGIACTNTPPTKVTCRAKE
jgi:hypothetical protein